MGKTTTAVHLAETLALARPESSVTLIDCDPMQQALKWWVAWQGAVEGTRLRQPPQVVVVGIHGASPAATAAQIAAAGPDGFVILDMPGGAAAEMQAKRTPLYGLASVLLVPSRASVADAGEVIASLTEVGGTEIPVAVLFTLMRPRAEAATSEVSDALESRGLTLLNAVVPSSAAVERSYGLPLSRQGRAAYSAVAEELLNRMGW